MKSSRNFLLPTVLVFSLLIPANLQADVVSDGDASTDVFEDGALLDFIVGPAGDQFGNQTSNFISIDGGPLVDTFDYDINSFINVVGNTWTSQIESPGGEITVDYAGTITNPVDGDNLADVTITATITNISGSALSVANYFYTDLDPQELALPDANDDLAFFGSGVITQNSPDVTFSMQVGGTQAPQSWEIDDAFDLFDKLSSAGSAITLANASSPYFGDVGTALRYDATLVDGESADITFFIRSVEFIPEPSSVLIALLGVVGTVVISRRRRISA